jgi:hypothetical protein
MNFLNLKINPYEVRERYLFYLPKNWYQLFEYLLF